MVLIHVLLVCRYSTGKTNRIYGMTGSVWAIGPSGSRAAQNEDAAAQLEDIRCRCEWLLTRVSERGWQDLDDQFIESCVGVPTEWRGVMRRMAMAGQAMCDL